MSKTLFDRGVALSALALAIMLPLAPAAAQENSVRPAVQSENRGGLQRAERRAEPRAERRAERQAERRAQPRAEGRAERPERASRAPDSGGFGSDVVRRAERVQQSQRAERIDRRSERRADGIDRRGERQAETVDRRGERRGDRLDWQGRNGAADRVERRGDRRAGRIEDRGDRRIGRVEQRSNDRVDRRDGWRDGRRDNWRGERRDLRRDQRNWSRDDWRHNYRGRNGWDNRDFRRWDRGWRGSRNYNWADYRRANRFHYRPGPYFAPFRSHRYSRLHTGFFLDSLFFQPRFFINDPWAYRLPPVYGPYQWVRYYDDVLLVDIYTGEVVDVINDFFW